MKNYLVNILIIACTVFNSCAPSRLVRPLHKGEKTVSANFGGPLIQYGNAYIPLPLTSLMYAQGITNNTSVFGSVHVTSLLFGIAQTDIGVCQHVYYNDSIHIGISINPALNFAQEFWPQASGGFKCWPQVDLNCYWEVKPGKSFFYAGIENWFELASLRANDQAQTVHWLFCPQLGYTISRTKMNYSFELKDIAPNLNNLPNVVTYLGFGGKGALGFYFTATRKF